MAAGPGNVCPLVKWLRNNWHWLLYPFQKTNIGIDIGVFAAFLIAILAIISRVI